MKKSSQVKNQKARQGDKETKYVIGNSNEPEIDKSRLVFSWLNPFH